MKPLRRPETEEERKAMGFVKCNPACWVDVHDDGERQLTPAYLLNKRAEQAVFAASDIICKLMAASREHPMGGAK